MIVTRDFRRRFSNVTIKMDIDEFRETVEWMEMFDPRDGATAMWRQELDRIDPPEEDE